MNYDVYLFSNLIKFYDKGFEELPYDEQYDILPTLFDNFENSSFNVNTRSAYDCIIDYLNDKYSINTNEIDTNKIDDKVLDRAKQYLCADDENDLINQITNIQSNVNKRELIDYVDEVVVWSKLEFEFTCQEFLDIIYRK
jgi:hypothetical protein